MMTRFGLALIASVVALFSQFCCIPSNAFHAVTGAKKEIDERSPFRYFIFGNWVDRKHHSREMRVFLDEKAFSEDTLKKLFSLLSRRYPRPETLAVKVYTHLEQVPTPEEEDSFGGMSETRGNPMADRYHWAFYMRDPQKEWFSYNPAPPGVEINTVMLRGKRPM